MHAAKEIKRADIRPLKRLNQVEESGRYFTSYSLKLPARKSSHKGKDPIDNKILEPIKIGKLKI